MINRRVTRTILETTETTSETQSLSSDALAFVLTDAQKFYVGFQGRFASRHFAMGTANTNAATLTVKYWDGTAFTAVEDLLDQTDGMTKSGFISWQNVQDWVTVEQTPVDDVALYWIEITTDTTFSVGTTLQSVITLFSDDEMLRIFYPELINDATYLPAGRTDFLEQHNAARIKVLRRLKQRNKIQDDEQIIDVNEVAEASVHCAAWMILNPIARSESDQELRDEAFENFEREIRESDIRPDLNKDGVVVEAEREIVRTAIITRR